ncbi:MAG: glycosyltransferase family 2 protein [Verrucomicrobiota bacterium]
MPLPRTAITLPPAPAGRSGWPWRASDSALSRYTGFVPRISIVTPSFNQAAFLEETIRSVLLQGYPNLQYIVIDGGSTDGSVDILRKYEPWLDYWVSEPDRGQSHAIGKGLARCDGTWFNWINSDDLLLPNALACLATAAGISSVTRIAAGTTQNLRDGSVFGSYTASVKPPSAATFFSLGVNQPGSLLHRETVQSLGGVREDLRLTMDLDLWLRVFLQHGPQAFVSVHEPVACYRYHTASKTCSADDVFALDEFALLFDLATQCGVDTSVLAAVRQKSAIAPTTFPTAFAPATPDAERAWLDRLLISDSLLFRALRSAHQGPPSLGTEFTRLLERLRPALVRHFPKDIRKIEARALIHAQQVLGRPDTAMSRRALLRRPSPNTAMETVRLVANRFRTRR